MTLSDKKIREGGFFRIEEPLTEPSKKEGEVVYSMHRGFRRYALLQAAPETLENWKAEIDSILQDIREGLETGEFSAMTEWHRMAEDQAGEDRRVGNPETVRRILKEEILDEDDEVLLAIGLFILRHKSSWNRYRASIKVLLGGHFPLDEILSEKGWTHCYDSAIIARELATMYGVKGEVRGRLAQHAYFETWHGKVCDPMLGWRRAGLFQSKERFRIYRKKLGFKGRHRAKD
jgi:hypothetical protein